MTLNEMSTLNDKFHRWLDNNDGFRLLFIVVVTALAELVLVFMTQPWLSVPCGILALVICYSRMVYLDLFKPRG